MSIQPEKKVSGRAADSHHGEVNAWDWTSFTGVSHVQFEYSASNLLKFLVSFKQGTPRFLFALGSKKSVAIPWPEGI